MLLLHGIYGAGRNWRTVARRLVRARPDWAVVLVDLRSHGQSPSLAPHTLKACAEDVLRLERRLGGPADAVLGHSFGGKVALLHAGLREGRGSRPRVPRSRQLWVVDSSPSAGRPGGSAWRMLGVLRRHPGPFGSRAEVVAAVRSEGFSALVSNWMAINAVRTDAGLEWRLHPDEMEAYLRDYFRTDAWRVVERPPDDIAVHVIRARASRVLGSVDIARLRRAMSTSGPVFLHEVAGGHWVNTENPDALHAILAARLA